MGTDGAFISSQRCLASGPALAASRAIGRVLRGHQVRHGHVEAPACTTAIGVVMLPPPPLISRPAPSCRLIVLQPGAQAAAGSTQLTPEADGAAASRDANLHSAPDSWWACMGTGALCGATIGRACCEGGCSCVLPNDASTCRCINGPESISMEWLEGT